MTGLRPTLDYVLLEEIKESLASKAGIILTGDNNKSYKVLAVGPIGSVRDKDVKMLLQPGDIVFIDESKAKTIKYKGRELTITRQENIWLQNTGAM